MKIFISHAVDNYDLAKILKDILEESELIDDAFIFEDKKKYGKAVDKKITDEIIQSDYLIAIITDDSLASASVNQELGYAQALGMERIPMIQKDSELGFLIYGDENLFYTKHDFKEKCLEIRKYVTDNGLKPKYSKEEIELIQKSAHYRQIIEYTIHSFLDSIYYRFDVGGRNLPGLANHGDPKTTKKYCNQIKKFFERSEKTLIQKISQIDFSMYGKLDSEMMMCKHEIQNADRFPNTEMLQKEIDLIVSLKENLLYMEENDLDVRHYCKNIFGPNQSFEFSNCSELMKIKKYELEIKNHLRWIIIDLKKIAFIMIELSNLYALYRKNFGNLAFKNTI